jgi:hypothetical protein
VAALDVVQEPVIDIAHDGVHGAGGYAYLGALGEGPLDERIGHEGHVECVGECDGRFESAELVDLV